MGISSYGNLLYLLVANPPYKLCMPAISASAPGKIILFGEHAVVYGRPAIAVPLTQVQAKAFVLPEPGMPSGYINIQAPNIGLEANLSDLSLKHPIGAAINGVLSEIDVSQPPAFTLRVTSNIPLAAGLGSGAAVSAAIIRALSTFLGHPLSEQRVSDLVFEVEKIHHGTPSGIDNTVITYEMPVFFIRDDLLGNTIETFKVARPFTIVIADTGISSPTSTTVGDVRFAWENNPAHYEQLFDETGEVVLAARSAIQNGQIEALGALMNENHSLLIDIGVSSPELDHLVMTARTTGALGAKLSGGGRGGNIIALTDNSSAEYLADSLAAAGAVHTQISVIK